jgi:hypothetical protein
MHIYTTIRLSIFCLIGLQATAQSLASLNSLQPQSLSQRGSAKPQQLLSAEYSVADATYLSVICTGELNWENLPQPQLEKTTGLNLLESHFDLGCNGQQGFQGYFEPGRWSKTSLPQANALELLLETEAGQFLSVNSKGKADITFIAPSSGVAMFQVSEAAQTQVFQNGRSLELGLGSTRVFLNPGDQLRLSLGEQATKSIRISDFQFLSDLSSLILREWRNAEQQVGYRQYIGIERPNLGNVRFPKNISAVGSVNPEYTGYPVLDADGDLLSTQDQIHLMGTFNHVSVSYEDQIDAVQGRVLRTWTIRDACADNILSETQELTLEKTPLKNKRSKKQQPNFQEPKPNKPAFSPAQAPSYHAAPERQNWAIN